MKYSIRSLFLFQLIVLLAACGGGGGSSVAQVNIIATAGPSGSISPVSITIDAGTAVDFTLTPDSGYAIDTVTGCGGTLSGAIYTTAAVSTDCTIDASFTDTPKVISTTPADVASGVARDSTISAVFSEDMFSQTVDGSSFTLANGGNVASAVSFNGATNEAKLTPDQPLEMLTLYTATLTTAITDLAGNPLAADENWSFTTADGAWDIAAKIENNDDGDAQYPQIAINDAGDATAVWQQSDGVRTNIRASRYSYTLGEEWGAVITIENDDAGDARYPQVAVDDAGNAIAVWQQFDGARWNIMFNRYAVGSGWNLIGQAINTGNASVTSYPQIAIDESGNALAVWEQFGISYQDIWASRYTVQTNSWSTPELIDSQDEGYAEDPQVAMNGTGDSVVVWHQNENNNTSTSANIWARYYTAGVGWGAAELIESNTGQGNHPQAAIDDAGNALAVWQQGGGAQNIWANRYTVGQGWGIAELIENDVSERAVAPRIAINGAGDALAVWYRENSATIYWDAWANRYTVGQGWGTAELIENNDAGSVADTTVAMDSAGNGLAVWRQMVGGPSSILSNRYVAGSGWGTAELIEADDVGNARFPELAIDGAGNGLTVWFQTDGVRDNIWANRFE